MSKKQDRLFRKALVDAHFAALSPAQQVQVAKAAAGRGSVETMRAIAKAREGASLDGFTESRVNALPRPVDAETARKTHQELRGKNRLAAARYAQLHSRLIYGDEQKK